MNFLGLRALKRSRPERDPVAGRGRGRGCVGHALSRARARDAGEAVGVVTFFNHNVDVEVPGDIGKHRQQPRRTEGDSRAREYPVRAYSPGR
jgi:hypothetical protein